MAGLVPGSSTIYLESYIESTGSLPPELQRILTTIAALDERCLQLSESVHNSLAILLKPDSHGTLHEQAEYQEAQNSIGVEQQLLLQFAEEKVQLAHRVSHWWHTSEHVKCGYRDLVEKVDAGSGQLHIAVI